MQNLPTYIPYLISRLEPGEEARLGGIGGCRVSLCDTNIINMTSRNVITTMATIAMTTYKIISFGSLITSKGLNSPLRSWLLDLWGMIPVSLDING